MSNTSPATTAEKPITKLVLTCTVTGKTVTWTNREIIAAKIKQAGSLEAFVKNFKCRGANKFLREKAALEKAKLESSGVSAVVTSAPVMSDILRQGVDLGAKTAEQVAADHPTGERPTGSSEAPTPHTKGGKQAKK